MRKFYKAYISPRQMYLETKSRWRMKKNLPQMAEIYIVRGPVIFVGKNYYK